MRWSIDRFKAGTVTLAGDNLLILRETGELMLAPVMSCVVGLLIRSIWPLFSVMPLFEVSSLYP